MGPVFCCLFIQRMCPRRFEKGGLIPKLHMYNSFLLLHLFRNICAFSLSLPKARFANFHLHIILTVEMRY